MFYESTESKIKPPERFKAFHNFPVSQLDLEI